MTEIVLASASEIRVKMLAQAGLDFDVHPARIDEDAVLKALVEEGAPPRDISDKLAEMKARRVSEKHPGALVIGCDQVLDLAGDLMSKPKTQADARAQLQRLAGNDHRLSSAAVVYEDGRPVWRHVGQTRLRMHTLSERFIRSYVDDKWDEIRHCVGCYKIEEGGVRLFNRIDGSYFVVLGLPLIELLSYFTTRGVIEL